MDKPATSTPRPEIWLVSLKEAGLLILVAAGLTVVSWQARTEPLPLLADPTVYELELTAPVIEISTALDLFDEGAHLFIDTRSGQSGNEPTIAAAFIIRESSFDDDLLVLFDDLFPEDPVILFGNGDLVGTNNVAGRLQARGFTDIQILRGGMQGWLSAGGDVGDPYLPEGFDHPAQEEQP